MPTWYMNEESFALMEDWKIAHDVLQFVSQDLDRFEFHKVTKRLAINQAAYAVAKTFGHRSAFHDLYLAGPNMTKHALGRATNDTGFIPVTQITTREVYLSVLLMGKEGKKELGAMTVANQVEIDCRGNGKWVFVDMVMTGPAFLNLVGDVLNANGAARFRNKIKAKWGSMGTTTGKFSLSHAHDRVVDGNTDRSGSTNAGNLGEGYRYIRLWDGIPKTYQPGFGWHGVA